MKLQLVCLVVGVCLVGMLQGAAVENAVMVQKEEAPPPAAALDINEDCHQPKETGRCFALFRRFAYNVESRECQEFIYGGCAGNKNNFETIEECEDKCIRGKAMDTTEPAVAATAAAAEDEDEEDPTAKPTVAAAAE